ncbi:MAG: hypothetical protein FJ387_15395 [Verrucomicrobia bacterium]|nr:hypothetical protein [Verrucomicrobiota bacterium]
MTDTSAGRTSRCAAAVFLAGLGQVLAATITNVSLVNVTPSSFTVLWHTAPSTPAIEVFADPTGTSSLAGRLGVEAFPLQGGNPAVPGDYEQRQYQRGLRQKTRSLGLMQMRVSGGLPGATYYYRLTSALPGEGGVVFPAQGPLPAVTLPRENTFLAEAQQLLLDVPGPDTYGGVLLLTHPEAAYALATVVGDGCATNQACFSLGDFFALTGGQFTPTGNQEFTVRFLGPSRQDVSERLTLAFTGAFTVAQRTLLALHLDFAALSLGWTVVRAGSSESVPIQLNSSAALATVRFRLETPFDRLTNLRLEDLAPELDAAAAQVLPLSPGAWQVLLPARPGQLPEGAHQLGRLSFLALANRPSAFVSLVPAGFLAEKADLTPVTRVRVQAGRVVVVGREPLLEARLRPDRTRELLLYGQPGSSYAIQFATSLDRPMGWTLLARVPLASLFTGLAGLEAHHDTVFYRAFEFSADPPFAEARLHPDRTRSLLVYGLPAQQYTVEFTTNLSALVTWQPLLDYTLTNAFRSLPVPNLDPTVFYRLRTR